MAARPNLFDRSAFEASLRQQGCPESFVSPTVSDFRLFVPLLLRELGEERVLEIVEGAREELGLGPQQAAWRTEIRYMVGWAEEEVEQYKERKTPL